MSEVIEFDVSHKYSPYKTGIVVDAFLRHGDQEVRIDARIDTGSTYCIFERGLGEGLGLVIESGIPADIGTVTGSFRVYGHEVELEVLGAVTDSTVYFTECGLFDRNVLGRTGWPDRVKLGLIEPEGRLLLSEYKN